MKKVHRRRLQYMRGRMRQRLGFVKNSGRGESPPYISLYNAHSNIHGVSGRHCVSVVLIHYLLVDTPYILGHVVDHRCDTTIESFVVHSPTIGAHRIRL